jgi:hypothetical protein
LPLPLPITKGSSEFAVLNVIIPDVGHDSFDREYHDIHEISPVTVIFIVVPVLVIISVGMVSRGAVLSIL